MGVDVQRIKKDLKIKIYFHIYIYICFVTIFIFTFRNKLVSASKMLVNKLLGRILPIVVKNQAKLLLSWRFGFFPEVNG
jgi:hypothetical protein